MTPQERRESIEKRIQAGGWSNYRMVRESGFTGLQGYRDGQKACDENIYKVEQSLDKMEAGMDHLENK
jgi:hypothetical protein